MQIRVQRIHLRQEWKQRLWRDYGGDRKQRTSLAIHALPTSATETEKDIHMSAKQSPTVTSPLLSIIDHRQWSK